MPNQLPQSLPDQLPSLEPELRRLDEWLQINFGGLDRPDDQDLVDVITGQATKAQELLVAAYRRASVRGQREYELLEKEYDQLTKSATQPWRQLPVFIAKPLLIFGGLRSKATLRAVSETHEIQLEPGVKLANMDYVFRAARDEDVAQTFEVAELDLQVVLYLPRRQGEYAEVTGTITRNAQPAEQTKVTLRGTHGVVRRRTTDEVGFFAFRNLPPNIYRLRITCEDGVVLIPNLTLILQPDTENSDLNLINFS